MLLCAAPREVDSETRSCYYVVPREAVNELGHVTMYSAKRGGLKKLGHVTMYSAKRG